MSRPITAIATVSLCSFVSGCAIHPTPKDYARVSTFEIVRQIRCETREAVINSALTYVTAGKNVDAETKRIGAGFVSGGSPIQKFSPLLFKGNVRDTLSLFWKTGVAYNFKLEMTEINNLGGDINFLKTFTKSSLTLGLTAGLDRQRQNTRTFTVTDNFGDLVQKLSPKYCDKKIVKENYIYPIAGRIGVEEMVQTFVYLSLFGNLGGKEDNPKGPPTLVDALNFETTISGSASPKVTFTPIGRGFSVSDFSLNATASRKDAHSVVVGLALDEADVGRAGEVKDRLVGSLLTASADNRAERVAATAVDQFLAQNLFRPTIVVDR